MKICFNANIIIDTDSPNLKFIIKAFRDSLRECFEGVVVEVLKNYANEYMRDGTLCKMLKSSKLSWKSSCGNKVTSILTIFGKIRVPQLQVSDHDTGRRIYITRLLLGIEPRVRIPEITKKMLGLMGSLATYRVVRKIASIFSATKVSLMTIVRCIRDTGKRIDFTIDEEAKNEFEADGTGIPMKNTGKRGKELKILAQRKENGGIRIAGMVIDRYKRGWDEIFEPLKDSLKRFGEIFLITDGDSSPLKGIDGIKVILQRCLFHIGLETKYTLWQDKVKRKSHQWKYILARILEITNVKRIREDEAVGKNIIKWKRDQFVRLIDHCRKEGYKNTVNYLTLAKDDLFGGIERRIMGGTTSLIERVMRTINMRINLGKWTSESALAVSKIRGAYYYNGFDV